MGKYDPTHRTTSQQSSSGDTGHRTTSGDNRTQAQPRQPVSWWSGITGPQPTNVPLTPEEPKPWYLRPMNEIFSGENVGNFFGPAADWISEQGNVVTNWAGERTGPAWENVVGATSEIAKPLAPVAKEVGKALNVGYNLAESTGIPGTAANVAEALGGAAGQAAGYIGQGVMSGAESLERTGGRAIAGLESQNVPWYAKPLAMLPPGQAILEEQFPAAKEDIQAGEKAAPWLYSEALAPSLEAASGMIQSVAPSSLQDIGEGLQFAFSQDPETVGRYLAKHGDKFAGALVAARENMSSPEYHAARELFKMGYTEDEVKQMMPINETARMLGQAALDPLNVYGAVGEMAWTSARTAQGAREFAVPTTESVAERIAFRVADGHQISKEKALELADRIAAEGVEQAVQGVAKEPKLARAMKALNPLGLPNQTKAQRMIERANNASGLINNSVRRVLEAAAENPDVAAMYVDSPLITQGMDLIRGGASVDDAMMQLAPTISRTMAEAPEQLVPLVGNVAVSEAGRDLSAVLREWNVPVKNGLTRAEELDRSIQAIRNAPATMSEKQQIIRQAEEAVAASDTPAARKALQEARKTEVISAEEKADRMLVETSRAMWGSVQAYYPTHPVSGATRARNAINNFLSVYAFMGYNPAYAIRNLSSNVGTLAFDGLMLFDDTTRLMDDMDRFLGFVPASARREVVGAAGIKEPARGAPAMRISNQFERDASTRAVVSSMRDSYTRWPRPPIPAEITGGMPNGVRQRVENAMKGAVNEQEALDAAKLLQSGGEDWRYIEPAMLDQLREVSPAVAEEAEKILASAKTSDEFYKRMAEIQLGATEKVQQVKRMTDEATGTGDVFSDIIRREDQSPSWTGRGEDGKKLVEERMAHQAAEQQAAIDATNALRESLPPNAAEILGTAKQRELEMGAERARVVYQRLDETWSETERLRAIGGQQDTIDKLWANYRAFRDEQWTAHHEEVMNLWNDVGGSATQPTKPTTKPPTGPAVAQDIPDETDLVARGIVPRNGWPSYEHYDSMTPEARLALAEYADMDIVEIDALYAARQAAPSPVPPTIRQVPITDTDDALLVWADDVMTADDLAAAGVTQKQIGKLVDDGMAYQQLNADPNAPPTYALNVDGQARRTELTGVKPSPVVPSATSPSDIPENAIPVYRGTGKAGLSEMRPSEEGVSGAGIYFYDNPFSASAYAEREGGIITGYVRPEDVRVIEHELPGIGGIPGRKERVIIIDDPNKLIRRGNIPVEQTLDRNELTRAAETAISAPFDVAVRAREEIMAGLPDKVRQAFIGKNDLVPQKRVISSFKKYVGKEWNGGNALKSLTDDELRYWDEYLDAVIANGGQTPKPYPTFAERQAQMPMPEAVPAAEAAQEAPITAEAIQREAQERIGGSIAVADINVDAKRFQSKASTDERGASSLLKDVTTWDPIAGAGIAVWVDPVDGKTYVVDGHHRVELAKRLGEKEILAPLYLPAETAEDALLVGAMRNIKSGRGTPVDAAKIFRSAGMTEESLIAQGISLKESVARDGLALAGLHDSLFTAVINDKLPLERAIIIGQRLPDKDLQLELIRLIDEELRKGHRVTNDIVTELCDAITSAPQMVVTQDTLFGVETSTRSLLFRKAEFLGYTKGRLRTEGRIFKSAAKNADAIAEAGVGEIDKLASSGIAEDRAQLLEIFDLVKNRKGRISDIANEAAEALERGGNEAKIREEYFNRIVEALPEEIKSQFGAGAAAGAGGLSGTDTGLEAPFAGFEGADWQRKAIGETYGPEQVEQGLRAGERRAGEVGTEFTGTPATGPYDVTQPYGRTVTPDVQHRFKMAAAELPAEARDFLGERGVFVGYVAPDEITDPEMADLLRSAYAMTGSDRSVILFNAEAEDAVSALAHETVHSIVPYISDDMLDKLGGFIGDTARDMLAEAERTPALRFVLADMEKALSGDAAALRAYINGTNLSEKQAEILRQLADKVGIAYEGTWDLEKLVFFGMSERRAIALPEVAEELLASQAVANGFHTQLFADGLEGFRASRYNPMPGKKPAWLLKRVSQDANQNPFETLADASTVGNGRISELVRGITDDVIRRWGKGTVTPGVSEETYNAFMQWVKGEWIPSLTDMRSTALRVAQHRRDFALHNYADRRNIDIWIHNVAPYFYWASRTYPKWALRFLEHPEALANYLRYRRTMNEKNQDLPEWYRQQISVSPFGGDPLYFNLEAMINPLYQLQNNFEDWNRTKTDTGKLFSAMANVGMMPWTPLTTSYALSRYGAGKPEEATAWQGYMSPVTRAAKSATALVGLNQGQGATLEPWLWEGWDQGQPRAFSGMDPWQWNRVPKKPYEMAQRGEITPEQLAQVEYAQQGPLWEQAKTMAIQERAPSDVAGFLLGTSFRGRTPSDVELERAGEEWYNLTQQIYSAEQTLPKEEVARLFAEFYDKYPFYSAVQMGRRGDAGQWIAPEGQAQPAMPQSPASGQVPAVAQVAAPRAPVAGAVQDFQPTDGSYYLKSRAETYANDVLFRLPPGKPGAAIRDRYGIPGDLLGKFYDSNKTFQGWVQEDINRFMGAIEAMGDDVLIPTAEEKAQFEYIRATKAGVDDALKQKYGPDIFEINSGYPYNGTAAEKKEYRETYPQLPDFWREQDRLRQEAGLEAWYGSDRESDPKYQRAKELFGDNIHDLNERYFDIKERLGSVAAKNFASANPSLGMYWTWSNAKEGDTEGWNWTMGYRPSSAAPPKPKTYGSYGKGPTWKKHGGKSSYSKSSTVPWWLYPKPWFGAVHWRF